MKASELRLGNLVIHDSKVKKVTTIGEKAVLLGKEMYAIPYDYIVLDPIPLTPEWLERAGFRKLKSNIPNRIIYEKGRFIFAQIKGKGQLSFSGAKINDIDYVHELQNLWYALTKQELSIE